MPKEDSPRPIVAILLLLSGVAVAGVAIAALVLGDYVIGSAALVAGVVLVLFGYLVLRRRHDEAAGEQQGVAGGWGQSLARKTNWGRSLLRKTKPDVAQLRKTQVEISDETRRTPRQRNKDAG